MIMPLPPKTMGGWDEEWNAVRHGNLQILSPRKCHGNGAEEEIPDSRTTPFTFKARFPADEVIETRSAVRTPRSYSGS